VALAPDALVLGLDAAQVAIALAAPAPAAPVATVPGRVLVLELAKPVFATALQLGWSSLISIDEPLVSDPRSNAGWFAATCAGMVSEAELPATFTLLAGNGADGLDESARVMRDACAPAAESGPLAFADSAFCLLVGPPVENGGQAECALVWREASGLQVCHGGGSAPQPLSEAELAELMATHPRRVGREPVDLPELAFPTVPRIDRRCFPPLAAVLRHLPERYRLEMLADDQAITLAEEGLPLATVALGAVAMSAPMLVSELQREALSRADEAKEQALLATYQPQVKALEAIGQAVRKAKDENRPLPDKASGLIGDEFGVTLDQVAGLFGGNAPTEAAALDGLGTWHPLSPDDTNIQWIWRIPLGPGTSLLLMPWGSAAFASDASLDVTVPARD
jgi:hypothetical protein